MSDEINKLTERLSAPTWFICKRENGTCEIVQSPDQESIPNSLETWGAFASQGEAIAKRVGLIRAGKCSPI
ncbi:DDE transposase family protein [Pseudanabaena sp. FACHB-1998]|uniref:DDE transposase family protein n=1 Tax=Pseudanabaena sp. FACHB-1998 TaxID=2692858 RepID=UPI001680F610|nr:DDE transposase family protein [Pseudanabaena sp. FACHB-1998]MBD2178734.1 DDE transposase family protein [Pseudanabaena sp. FACHB-1998]